MAPGPPNPIAPLLLYYIRKTCQPNKTRPAILLLLYPGLRLIGLAGINIMIERD